MSGRPKQKVYLYNDTGEFVKEIDSITKFADEFGYHKNLFETAYKYKTVLLKNNWIVSLIKIGKEGCRRFTYYENSKFVGHGKNISKNTLPGGKVELYDLDDDLIATFKSMLQFNLMFDTNVFCNDIFIFHKFRREFKYRVLPKDPIADPPKTLEYYSEKLELFNSYLDKFNKLRLTVDAGFDSIKDYHLYLTEKVFELSSKSIVKLDKSIINK